MRQPGRALRLPAEALDELLVLRVPLVEHLDRDAAAELLVLGQIDVRHPAGTELSEHAVAPVEDLVDEGVGGRHPLRYRLRAASEQRLDDLLRDRRGCRATDAALVLEVDRHSDLR